MASTSKASTSKENEAIDRLISTIESDEEYDEIYDEYDEYMLK